MNAKIYLCLISVFFIGLTLTRTSQNANPYFPDSIAPVGVIPGLSDDELVKVVQRQTFRFFWHRVNPGSGLALERSNTIRAEHYWYCINEAWNEPNLSENNFGSNAGAIGGNSFGIMNNIVAVERG